MESIDGLEALLQSHLQVNFQGEQKPHNGVALPPEGGELLTESYVNLIPTALGTHVNGLRQGLLDAMREFANSAI